MAMTSLPRFFLMEWYGSYLSIASLPSSRSKKSNDSLPLGFMTFSDDEDVWSPRAKFATEKSETGDDMLVHIRSCYNNKYWVAQQFYGSYLVAASADKPEEDKASPACTLFRVTCSAGHFQFQNVNKSMFATHDSDDDSLGLDRQNGPFFSVADWETLVILPLQVSFVSEDLKDQYLCSRVINNYYNYHRFESGVNDVADPMVAHQLFPTRDGNYRIKNLYFHKLWRRSPDWIWADANDDDRSDDTLFSFVKLGDDVVALRNFGNNHFCGALTKDGLTNCLNARYPTITTPARLIVKERVLKRTITDVKYRISDSRIYGEKNLEVDNAFAKNDSPDKDATLTLSFSLSDSRTTSWNNSVSVKVGVNVGFETDIIPFIEKAKVQVSTEVSYSHQWGGSTTTTNQRSVLYAVVVPPLTTMKVTLLCTKGACDVPFSYTQRDLLPDGTTVTTVKDDGIFTGINSYDFYLESSKADP